MRQCFWCVGGRTEQTAWPEMAAWRRSMQAEPGDCQLTGLTCRASASAGLVRRTGACVGAAWTSSGLASIAGSCPCAASRAACFAVSPLLRARSARPGVQRRFEPREERQRRVFKLSGQPDRPTSPASWVARPPVPVSAGRVSGSDWSVTERPARSESALMFGDRAGAQCSAR